jgi:prepilin-type processing-associated H-X9-DG protein
MKTQYWRAQGIVLVEGDTGFSGAIGAGGASNPGRYGVYTNRHIGGANYLLGDGHAEFNFLWNQDDNAGVGPPPAPTFVKHPESNWNNTNQGQPKDYSVWGHNPFGRVNSSR